MRFTAFSLGLGLLAVSSAVACAKPSYVPSTVNLRAAPKTTSDVITKIPGGSLIDAENCTDGWCAVTWQGQSGFSIETALDLSGRVPSKHGPSTQAPRGSGYVEEEPIYTV